MHVKRTTCTQKGQVLILFAFTLSLFMLALSAMVWDLTALYYESSRVQSAAQVGATAGAGQVDETKYFETGGKGVFVKDGADMDCVAAIRNLVPDYSAATCRPTGTANAPKVGGGTVSGPTQVRAHVERSVTLPVSIFGGSAQTVVGEATAQVVSGTSLPASPSP